MSWAERVVRDRMDPALVHLRVHRTQQPQAFWFDPRSQTIRRGGWVWTHVPIHDPAWATP